MQRERFLLCLMVNQSMFHDVLLDLVGFLSAVTKTSINIRGLWQHMSMCISYCIISLHMCYSEYGQPNQKENKAKWQVLNGDLNGPL